MGQWQSIQPEALWQQEIGISQTRATFETTGGAIQRVIPEVGDARAARFIPVRHGRPAFRPN
jgi:hypothetical protein